MSLDTDASPLQLWPALSPATEAALRESIERWGVLVPVARDQHGRTIDGHHRARIADELGCDYAVIVHKVEDDDEARELARTLNADRRHLTVEQRREMVAHLREQGHSTTAIGDALNVNQSTVSRDLQVMRPHNVPETVTGQDGKRYPATKPRPSVIARNQREAEKAQAALAELSPDAPGGLLSTPEARREVRRSEVAEHVERIAAGNVETVAGRYDVLVIDPPWPMRKIDRDVRPNQVEFDYPTMSVMCERPWWPDDVRINCAISDEREPCNSIECSVGRIIHEQGEMRAHECNMHVWLWTTHKFLPDALALLDNWHARYVCTFVWHKPGGFQPIGLPQYNSEFALYARIGSPSFIDTKAFPTCFEAPRGKHSEKPAEFYSMVRRVTTGRRLDMFNRRTIEGFDGWGLEAAGV